MAGHELEVILMRQLASALALPLLLVDPRGELLYYNEPAEGILGRTFDETGELRRDEIGSLFRPTQEDGTPLKREERPIAVALDQRRPSHRRFWIRALDGQRRRIEATAFPLLGQNDRMLGAVALFWEIDAA